MTATKLIDLATKAGWSVRKLSVALGKDFSYLGSMARRDAELSESVVERAMKLLGGEEIPAWQFAGKPIDAKRLSSAIQKAGGVDAIIDHLDVLPGSMGLGAKATLMSQIGLSRLPILR